MGETVGDLKEQRVRAFLSEMADLHVSIAPAVRDERPDRWYVCDEHGIPRATLHEVLLMFDTGKPRKNTGAADG